MLLLAVLEFLDFLIIGVLVAVLTGGTAMASRHAATEERLRRIEDKLNVLLTHMGIDYVPQMKERWQRLADADKKQEAAEEYSNANSVTLEEARQVVEQYLADVQQSG